MKSVKDGERHGDMCDHWPGPISAIKFVLYWMRISPVSLYSVDHPHGQVAHQQKCHHLATRFFPHLLLVGSKPARGIQDEDSLQRGLEERGQGGQEGDQAERIGVQHEERPDDAEDRVEKYTSLSDYQQQVV